MRLVRIITEDGESVEFEAEKVVLRHKPEGLTVLPSSRHENDLGFIVLFHPWNVIRQIKEYESDSGGK